MYNCNMSYVSFMVTTEKIPTVDTQKKKRMKAYHYKRKNNHKDRKQVRKRVGMSKNTETNWKNLPMAKDRKFEKHNNYNIGL